MRHAFALALGGLIAMGCPADDDEGSDTDGACALETQSCADVDCCDGYGCDFSTVCVPCVPEGQARSVDDGGCCDGLTANMNTLVCEAMP